MRLAELFSVFLGILSLGTLSCLFFASKREFPRLFFGAMGLVGLFTGLISLLVRHHNELPVHSSVTLSVAGAGLYIGSLFLKRNGLSWAILAIAVAIRCWSVCTDGSALAHTIGLPGMWPSVLIFSFFVTAFLLGTAVDGMSLAHWYLAGTFSFHYLKRFALLMGLALLLRMGVEAVLLVGLNGEVGRIAGDLETVWNRNALLLLTRWTLGLFLPLLLTWLTLGCIKVESNTSATGIWYGALVFILGGELASVFLMGRIGIPL